MGGRIQRCSINRWMRRLRGQRLSGRSRTVLDGCGKLGVQEMGCIRPIGIGRVPAKGRFSSLMLVVRERFDFCHCVNVWP
jgi:hypothetical protein